MQRHISALIAVAITVVTLAGCQEAALQPGSTSPSPSPTPSQSDAAPTPSESPSAAPTPVPPVVTTWHGTIRRVDGRQAGVRLQLEETVQPNGTLYQQGSWTLQGDFRETTAVSGYRRDDVWTFYTTVGGSRITFEAPLVNRRLQGTYLNPQTREDMGHLDLVQQ